MADFYDENTDEFFESTVSLDLSELWTKFLEQLPSPAWILDAGCGSGRDSKHFKKLGNLIVAFDGSQKLADRASALLGQKVLHLNFYDLNLEQKFDGIWACASLLHLPKKDLTEIFKKLSSMLFANGTVYCSFKLGEFEGKRNGRYFTDLTLPQIQLILRDTGLVIFECWETTDLRPEKQSEKWLNCLLKPQ